MYTFDQLMIGSLMAKVVKRGVCDRCDGLKSVATIFHISTHTGYLSICLHRQDLFVCDSCFQSLFSGRDVFNAVAYAHLMCDRVKINKSPACQMDVGEGIPDICHWHLWHCRCQIFSLVSAENGAVVKKMTNITYM